MTRKDKLLEDLFKEILSATDSKLERTTVSSPEALEIKKPDGECDEKELH